MLHTCGVTIPTLLWASDHKPRHEMSMQHVIDNVHQLDGQIPVIDGQESFTLFTNSTE